MRSYAWLMIDGEDLVVMCRTSRGGLNNHDTEVQPPRPLLGRGTDRS